MTTAQQFVLTNAPIVQRAPREQTTPARIAVASWYQDRSERLLTLAVAKLRPTADLYQHFF